MRPYALTLFCGLLGSLAAVAPPADRQSPTALSAAISGVVVALGSRAPIESAMVVLTRRIGGVVSAQNTDSRGRFVFTDLPKGDYSLSASKPGFGAGQFGARLLGSLGATIRVADGEWFASAVIDLPGYAVVRGRVTDSAAEPAVGVHVRLIKPFVLQGETRLAMGPMTRSDDRGMFRFTDVPAGDYYIVVPSVQQSVPLDASPEMLDGLTAEQRARVARSVDQDLRGVRSGTDALITGRYATPPIIDGSLWTYPPTFYPGVSSLLAARPIHVDAGTTTPEFEMQLRPVRSHRVSGRLQSATDVRGVTLRLMPRGLEALGLGSEAATAVVGSDGSFTFLSVPAGDYALLAPGSTFEFTYQPPRAGSGLRTPGLPPTPGVGPYGTGAMGGLVALATDISFTARTSNAIRDPRAGFVRLPLAVDGDLTGLIVPVQPTAVITCRLIYEDLTGPVPNGSLELVSADADPLLGVHTNVVPAPVERNGKWTAAIDMPVVLPGEYALRPIGMTGLTIKSIVADGIDVSRRSITVGSGRAPVIEVTMTGASIRLAGIVTDDRAVAAAAAIVVAFPVDESLWKNFGFTPTWIRAAQTSSRGDYELSRLRAGDYYVAALSPDVGPRWTDAAFLKSISATARRLSLDWRQSATINLSISGSK